MTLILGNIATYPARHNTLAEVVGRIAPQVDVLRVVLNEYDSAPAGDFAQNVEFVFPKDDLKDVGKFYPSTDPKASYVFLFDDDILYPADYVKSTCSAMEDQGDNGIYGYHGSTYLPKTLTAHPSSWYGALVHNIFKSNLRKSRRVYHFEKNVAKTLRVDQIGSGVSALPASLMPSFDVMAGSAKFTDVRLARWAYEQGIKIFCLEHEAGWLDTLEFEEEIFRAFTRRTPDHVLQEIYQFAGRAHRTT